MKKAITVWAAFLLFALVGGYLGALLFDFIEPDEPINYHIIITDNITEEDIENYFGPLLESERFY